MRSNRLCTSSRHKAFILEYKVLYLYALLCECFGRQVSADDSHCSMNYEKPTPTELKSKA